MSGNGCHFGMAEHDMIIVRYCCFQHSYLAIKLDPRGLIDELLRKGRKMKLYRVTGK